METYILRTLFKIGLILKGMVHGRYNNLFQSLNNS